MGSPSSPHGSSTAVNRHPGASQPNITVSSPPPPPPPPPPFVSHHSHPSAIDEFVRDSHANDDDDADIELDEHAFDHPATYKPAPWIWVPRDPLGLSSVIVEELNMAGVSASDTGATVDKHGVVKVSRNPPDEEWEGGIDI
ncbi:hypothetical protein AURDEDRAFT_56051 [Auricularia subglabra TFB-10046 SS5]|nr:hypothetical protein AURDEDRAFT_56051 [Auricularia subglabra TFB-10046 SS5]